MPRALLALLAALSGVLALAPLAQACSRDDNAYFDAFPDAACLLSQSSTEIDALGGLRLVTDGALTTETWDTHTQFGTALENLLAVSGTDAAATLELPDTALPLTPFAQGNGAVLAPPQAQTPDNDSVDDPSVIKTGADQYVMYYTGTAEDGRAPAVMRATSPDGRVWTRAGNGGAAQIVLQGGDPGDFDEHGVYGADVTYDAADQDAPYRMWFSGVGDVFTQVGYATSTDGITWTKEEDPVVPVGMPGSRDAFAATQPDVIRDGGLYKMWYEGDDSTLKSIHYATSTDGVEWEKGGMVIAAETVGSNNAEFGVFAPTVWKTGETFNMLLGGRKEVSQGVLQTKILGATSTDGIEWTVGGPEINPGSGFDSSNLNSPDLLQDPDAGASAFKLYYSGNSITDGDPHTRIGLSQTSNGTGWQGGKFTGAEAGGSVLDESTPGTAFDARSVEDLSVADANGTPDVLTGMYVGRRDDDRPRLGLATSANGTTFDRVAGGVVPDGGNNQFDEDGQLDPSLLYEQNGGGGTDDWFAYFTGIDDGTRSIGLSSAPETAVTLQPGTFGNPGQNALVAGDGAGFDATGVSHPSVVEDGANFVMFFTGHNGTATSIGRVSSTTPGSGFTTGRTEITLNGTAVCDEDGFRDPVVIKTGADWHMLYTGLYDSIDGRLERTCYATSADGTTWTRAGVAINPDRAPFAYNERGVTPSGAVVDGATLRVYTTGTDRTGRTRAGAATTAFPLVAGSVPSGWATFQYGNAGTPPQDFRTLTQTSSGTGVELWMSVLQPYAGDHWSAYFPVLTAAGTADLNFDLRVTGVRVQVREAGAAGSPALDKAELAHAPVQFAASGNAVTTEIEPPDTLGLADWTSVTVNSSLVSFGTGTGSATATILGTGDAQLIAATALPPGDTTISLDSVDAAAHPKLKVRFDLTSNQQQATPQINTLKVDYTAATATPTPTPTPTPTATPTPPPPPPPVLTLTASAARVVFGKTATLTGTLTEGYNLAVGASVVLTQQPRGATAFTPLATVLTGANGAYSQVVKPTKLTTYAAAANGAASPAPVTIAVAHRVTLKVTRRGRRVTLSGKVGPKHAKRRVTLQRKVGKGKFKRLARVRTNRRSAFKFTARMKKGRYQFRALTGADADHLAGRSPKRKLRVR